MLHFVFELNHLSGCLVWPDRLSLCSNDYILEINGRDKKDDYLNIKHLVLKHEELVDVLIKIGQAIRNQRLTG